jgi:hypothetical protein
MKRIVLASAMTLALVGCGPKEPECVDQCTEGAGQCAPQGLQFCETKATGCTGWSVPSPCPTGQACVEDKCAAVEPPPGVFNGKVVGIGLEVRSAAVFKEGDGVFIILSESSDLCKHFEEYRQPPKSSSFLQIGLVRIDATGGTISPTIGEYTVEKLIPNEPNRMASGYFFKYDSRCENMMNSDQSIFSSGTVTVDSLSLESGGSVRGSFALWFGDQRDYATGSFNAKYCDVRISSSGSGEPVCR